MSDDSCIRSITKFKINKVMARKKKVEEEQPVTAEVVETKKKSSKKAPKTKMSAQKESIQEMALTHFVSRVKLYLKKGVR